MPPSTLLVANRGEIAIRISRSAAELGLRTVSVHSRDDADCLHTSVSDITVALNGAGAAAYLDGANIIAVALDNECDAVHPGYGFLSENAAFARACAAAGLRFVGPRPQMLDLFGDKVRARAAAVAAGVPVLAGASVEAAGPFLASLGPGGAVMVKAVGGGGGRGMRVVRTVDELADAIARCSSEALASFGNGEVFIERYLPVARHIEVQIIGDGNGAVAHLGERDCSIQRNHQKIVEITPSPGLPAGLRERIIDSAVRFAQTVNYDNIGTFEFLVDASDLNDDSIFAFIEANPRLQVEHTVTEEVTGVDLVETQLRLTGGASLAELSLPKPRTGEHAMQLRINMGSAGGVLSRYDLPSGRGIRIDGFGYVGYTTSSRYDSLLAKLIVHRPRGTFAELAAAAYRLLCECRIDGVDTNIGFLQDLMLSPTFTAGDLSTRLVDDLAVSDGHPRRFADGGTTVTAPAVVASEHAETVVAPLQGTVVQVVVSVGDVVVVGQLLAVIESMKMEHEVRAVVGGRVVECVVTPGQTVLKGAAIVAVEDDGSIAAGAVVDDLLDLDHIRADLKEVNDRHAVTLDNARPTAVARRHAKGQRTARENVNDLVDAGTFVEYGPLTVAAQRRRRTMAELIEKSPADGMVTGIGSINGELFGDPTARCAVLAYDYTVFAGTQGIKNHAKTDRLIEVAKQGRLPLVLFGEGGGGRPGEDGGDYGETFAIFSHLSGLVPMVAIVSGRCYAGNASLVGCCDVIIATQNSNIGMGGPAMIEGGGLGVYRPEDIGPIDVQIVSGVVDIAVADEAEAVAVAKKYLSYFQGRVDAWQAPDQREMRRIIPENRLRAYDVRRVIDTIADVGSVLELRRGFGHGIVTSLVRVEGRPVGVLANDPTHLGGAIDSDGADKAARFMQLCDSFDLPLLSLVDTPGIMVGPEVEKTALVRHSSRLFLIGGNLTVPCFAILLRKVYGLGGIAMTGGSFKANTFTVAWPTGEWGTMGLEGSVNLAYRNEMNAIEDPIERRQYFDDAVAKEYTKGKAIRLATAFAIDDTIDPADSRFWLASLLASLRSPLPRDGKKRPVIDAW